MSDSLWPHELQHTRLPCPSLSSWVCLNSCPLSWWCHPIISSSVTHFSSCPQSFPASGSFPVTQLFTSGDKIIGALVSASILPMSIQGWFSLGLTGLILLSKGLARVLSRTIVRKHQFFGAIYSFFSDIGFSHMGYYRILSRVPCAIQEVLVNYFIYSSVCMLIPIS